MAPMAVTTEPKTIRSSSRTTTIPAAIAGHFWGSGDRSRNHLEASRTTSPSDTIAGSSAAIT